jgi:hypothetical protein
VPISRYTEVGRNHEGVSCRPDVDHQMNAARGSHLAELWSSHTVPNDRLATECMPYGMDDRRRDNSVGSQHWRPAASEAVCEVLKYQTTGNRPPGSSACQLQYRTGQKKTTTTESGRHEPSCLPCDCMSAGSPFFTERGPCSQFHPTGGHLGALPAVKTGVSASVQHHQSCNSDDSLCNPVMPDGRHLQSDELISQSSAPSSAAAGDRLIDQV